MADFAPPPGPPPPKVPEGWKAVWNPQYSEWFFVNIYTKQSQWDKPTEPVYPPGEAPPHGAPPGYGSTGAVSSHPTGVSEKSGFGSNNPYANMSEDEKLARKLQEEEEARAGRRSGDMRGQANDYYNQPGQAGGYGQQSPAPYAQGGQSSYQETSPQQDRGGKKGLLGKLLGKATGGSSSSSSHGYPPQQHGYSQQGYGQPQGYGGAPGGYYGGGYQQRPMGMPMGGGMMGGGRRPGGGGMGAGGAMALGAGGGLLGGALLGSAMADGGDGGDTYNNYGDDGGDYGGGDDMGGGDFDGGGGD
ncbi:hypothetical protein T440DRAFT_199499 [Plenodomus tracheiphilus IPT5]|uniref:WW domain-containing protein n=1 Tax=Plenodomus tracheiphilus IPT5 TaxID=1408161 RepID=A0A6A7BHR1_9PLEO|nr:hypothetical protein T440DRAFT_199499 [Plenodomus tracheiphilus IPT5]